MKESIYFDNHSYSFPEPKALEKAYELMKNKWAATSSPYSFAQEGLSEVQNSYEAIRQMLGLDDGDALYFVSSGAEAIHEVLFSFYSSYIRDTGKNHILTTSVEEAPILLLCKKMEALGISSKAISVGQKAQVSPALLEESIKPRTSLLSMSWANALTGVIHPVPELAQLAKDKGLYVHIDASHAIGKLYFRFQDLNVDFMTIDGRSIHAPLGTSVIIVKKGLEFSPTIVGKSSVDTAGIVSFKIALEASLQYFDHMSLEAARLIHKLENELQEALPHILVCYQNVERLPNCTTICFPGVVNESLLFLLDKQKLYASIGGGRHQKISALLQSCGTDATYANCAISFALSYQNTEEEVDKAVVIIVEEYKKLRALSMQLVGDYHEK